MKFSAERRLASPTTSTIKARHGVDYYVRGKLSLLTALFRDHAFKLALYQIELATMNKSGEKVKRHLRGATMGYPL